MPALVGQSFRSLPEAVSFLEKCDGKAPPEWVHPEVPQTSAWCSVDLALLDAFGRASGEPARPGMGAPAPSDAALRRYRYSGVVSAGQGWSYAVSLLKMRAFRFPTSSSSSSNSVPCNRPDRSRLLGRRWISERRQHGLGREQALEVIGQL